MYTGTLIQDLMATVERASALRKRLDEETELLRMFELQAPSTHREQVLAGAA
jgi:hypothetical protein